MGMKTGCPWCDRVFESSRYPRSAGYRIVMEKRKEHMKKKHTRKTKNYKEIRKIWQKKVYDSKNFLERYKDIFNSLFGNLEGQSAPDYNIVEKYSPENFEGKSEQEIREMIK